MANAGLDTVISMPLPVTGIEYEAFLNGRASHDSAGQIVFYSWTEIDAAQSRIVSPNADTSEVYIYEFGLDKNTIHQFSLEVRDDHGNVNFDTVAITIKRKFQDEFDGIPWDSTVGSLTYLNLNSPGGLSILFDPFVSSTPDILNFCPFNGNCNDISSWKIIPYVPYDSIKLMDEALFYSTNNGNAADITNGNDWVVIYATSNAGIDFAQKLSIGYLRLEQ